MVFVACGLNYRTAPIDIRERVALPKERQSHFLSQLTTLPTVGEAALLSTCNRMEIYCESTEPAQVSEWLAQYHCLNIDFIQPYLYLYTQEAAIRHTLRVASGLNSMMIGEPQIFGQMKQAIQDAVEAGAAKNHLQQIFSYVFRTSKRIRHHSGIGNGPISIAYAAVQCISKILPTYKNLKIFIMGSGETSSLVSKYLHKQGARDFFIMSRNQESAQQLVNLFQAKPFDIQCIPQMLSQADIVITATSCPIPFITQDLVQAALKERKSKPLFFLDLSVPRNIEPGVKETPHVHLYNIDDLQILLEQGIRERKAAALEAEQILENELNNYTRWYRLQKSKNILCDYREKMNQLAQQELKRAQNKLAQGAEQERVLSEFCERLVKKLTHVPTLGFRRAAYEDRSDLLDFAQFFLNASVPEVESS